MRRRKKLNYKNIIVIILLLLFLGGIIFSLINIFDWAEDNKNTDRVIEELDKMVEVEEVIDSDNTITTQNEEEIDRFDPYWDYIKMKLINVEFSDLKRANSDTVGWIKVNGTNINYPFVQTNDNSYYLTHSFDKSKNSSGWVFLDYRNDIDNLGKNTIIYAHGRVNGTMFGSLKNILESKWHLNKENYVVKLSTEKSNTLWQVFSVYRIPTTNDYIETTFLSDEAYLQFLNMLKDRSSFDFSTTISSSDKILTLSTCYNDTEKVVLHAKLIKQEIKNN